MKWVRCKTTSDYEPIILTPEQAFALVTGFPMLERTLTLLAAATGLRISECLGLQWQDLDCPNQKIHVRRTWLDGSDRQAQNEGKQPTCSDGISAGGHHAPVAERNSILQATGLGLSGRSNSGVGNHARVPSWRRIICVRRL